MDIVEAAAHSVTRHVRHVVAYVVVTDAGGDISAVKKDLRNLAASKLDTNAAELGSIDNASYCSFYFWFFDGDCFAHQFHLMSQGVLFPPNIAL